MQRSNCCCRRRPKSPNNSAAAAATAIILVLNLLTLGNPAQFSDAPYRVYWGVGSNAWLVDPINGGNPGNEGLAYDVAKWGITTFNRSASGSDGGMAFSIDPEFPQLGNPICERLGTHNPACHNASNLISYDPSRGGVPQAREANLTEFLHRIRGIYEGRVPKDFGGVCNIDFEGWQTNVWDWIWCPNGGGADVRARKCAAANLY